MSNKIKANIVSQKYIRVLLTTVIICENSTLSSYFSILERTSFLERKIKALHSGCQVLSLTPG
jgi:hypothetical protein